MSAASDSTASEKTSTPPTHSKTSSWIMWGLLGGIGTGLLLGEYCAPMKVFGDAYVGLMQMAVLPFISLSLIANVGKLSFSQSAQLAKQAGIVLLVLWGIGILTFVAMAAAFPQSEAGSFFTASLIEPPKTIDFVELFIPANPFRSFANNLVPAVVVFSLILGLALIGVAHKDELIHQLEVLLAGLSRMNGFIVKLAPIGIFAIASSAAGTMSLLEFGRLQGYLITYTAGALLVIFWIFPMLIVSCTGLRYRDILSVSRDALITAFATGSVFIVLPMLIENVKQLMANAPNLRNDEQKLPETVLPLAYPFPDVGKILGLLFIPFAAWFLGHTLPVHAYPLLIGAGVLGAFGSIINTIPFLLHLQELPSDMFKLFVLSGIYVGRVGDAVRTMHLLAFTCLTTWAIAGLLNIQWKRLTRFFAITAVAGIVLTVGIRSLLQYSFGDAYHKGKVIASMHVLEPKVRAAILEEPGPNPVRLDRNQSRLDRIQQRGVIRIGFNPHHLPFSYYNAKGELVGFDVDMAHRLAWDLGVTIEFIPFEMGSLERRFKEDHVDLAMAGIVGTVPRAARMPYTDSYLDATAALIVLDHHKHRYGSLKALQKSEGLRLAVLRGSFFLKRIREHLPQAEIVELNTEREFFEGTSTFDVLLTTAEGGSAWTLFYPRYTVVEPFAHPVRVPLVYPVGGRDLRFEEFLNKWIDIKKRDGTVNLLYNYWILGHDPKPKQPRWSIVRDVLHWVE